MANRVLRNWTDSEAVDKLSVYAERFFTRLFMVADDFGYYHANPKLLKAALFPLKEIRETDLSRWLEECEQAGLVAVYEVGGKKYLLINNFGQRLRKMTSKFPKIESADSPPSIVRKLPPEKNPETKQKPETEITPGVKILDSKDPVQWEKEEPPPDSAPAPPKGSDFFYIGIELIRTRPSVHLQKHCPEFVDVKMKNNFTGFDRQKIMDEFDKRTGNSFSNLRHFQNSFASDGEKLIKESKLQQHGNRTNRTGERKKFTNVLAVTGQLLKNDPGGNNSGGDHSPITHADAGEKTKG